MNIIGKILMVYRDFFLLYLLAIPLKMDITVWLWYSLCIVLAFALRLGIEFNKNRLTWRTGFIQSIYTITWCFFSVLVWHTFLKAQDWFEIYLFINSLFAVFIVGEAENFFQLGLKAWLAKKLGAIVGSDQMKGTEL